MSKFALTDRTVAAFSFKDAKQTVACINPKNHR